MRALTFFGTLLVSVSAFAAPKIDCSGQVTQVGSPAIVKTFKVTATPGAPANVNINGYAAEASIADTGMGFDVKVAIAKYSASPHTEETIGVGQMVYTSIEPFSGNNLPTVLLADGKFRYKMDCEVSR